LAASEAWLRWIQRSAFRCATVSGSSISTRPAPLPPIPKIRRHGPGSRAGSAYGSRFNSAAAGLRESSISETRPRKAARTAGMNARKCSSSKFLYAVEKAFLSKRKPREKIPSPSPVAGDRAGLCDDPPPEDPLPPSEIHVLEIREVLVVETGGQELLAPNRHQAAAGEEALLPGNGAGERSDGTAHVLLEGVAVE